MNRSPIIVWIRNDLRLQDNAAIFYAAKLKQPLLFVYIHSESDDAPYPNGSATKWWLHYSLEAFSKSLQDKLILRAGNPLDVLLELAKETKAKAIYWNRRYSPHHIAHDIQYKSALQTAGIEVTSFKGNVLVEPWELLNKQGNPFQVFTPFYKAAQLSFDIEKPLGVPDEFTFYKGLPHSLPLKALHLLPKIDWAKGFHDNFLPGEAGALSAATQFSKKAIFDYERARNLPSESGTSKLSPHLHFGEITPRQIHELVTDCECYVRQLYWREFAHYLLFHFPDTPKEPLHAKFAKFPWQNNKDYLKAWQQGLTGYPIVDAGMRELWHTGWMHNRVRMITGSFLVKHLLISWREGFDWFWDTLVDADLANNTLGWQWVGGCGADAAPYFRIFNPILQGEKFDPDGNYVKKYVPELAKLPAKYIHKPWELSESELAYYGVVLGKHYPYPIVDHAKARKLALEAFKKLASDPKQNHGIKRSKNKK